MKNTRTKVMPMLCALIAFFVATNAQAQYKPKELKQLKTANNYFNVGNYRDAMPIYKYLDSIIDNTNTRYRLGVCYMNSMFGKEKAIKIFESLKDSSDSDIPVDMLRYLGDVYHYKYRFDEAIEKYNEYIAQTAKDIKSADINKINYCKNMIAVCNNAKEITQKSFKVETSIVGHHINTADADYYPLINADETLLLFMRANEKNIHHPQIMMAEMGTDEWNEPVELQIESDDIKNKDVLLAGLSADGETVFLSIGTSNNRDLYTATIKGRSICELKKLNKEINSAYNEDAASLTPDGTKLYFTSDRPGGYGGYDIYVSKQNKKGEWDTPVNLGPTINTHFDERAPFIHPDCKTLYFSSSGHKTIGKRDIFISKQKGNNWTEPENLGFTNTTDDDYSVVVAANGQYGYYASTREKSRLDIFRFVLCDPIPLTLVRGQVKAGFPPKPVAATIKVYDQETKEQIKYIYTPNQQTGKYLMIFPPAKNYQLVISTPDFLPQVLNVFIPYQTQFYELYQEVLLSPIQINQVNVGEEVMVNNIFYNIYETAEADSIIGANKGNEIQQPEYYDHLLDLIGEIIETTDSAQISYTNKQPKTSEGKRRQNTDRLLSLVEEAFNTSDSVTLSILDANARQKDIVKESYFYVDGNKAKSHQMTVFGTDTFYTAKPIETEPHKVVLKEQQTRQYVEEKAPINFRMSTEKNRRTIFTHCIYYNVDESKLTAKAQAELEEVIKFLMDNPNIGAEINGYADQTGGSEHNIDLSQQRAQNVTKHLLNNGVDRRKLITNGHGTSLRNGKTENGAVNYRRVEIILFELKNK